MDVVQTTNEEVMDIVENAFDEVDNGELQPLTSEEGKTDDQPFVVGKADDHSKNDRTNMNGGADGNNEVIGVSGVDRDGENQHGGDAEIVLKMSNGYDTNIIKNGILPPRKKPGLPLLSDEERLKLKGQPIDMEQLKKYLYDVDQMCDHNIGRVLRQLKKLHKGDGVTYKNWNDGMVAFHPSPINDLGEDFFQLRQDAIAHEAKYGEDASCGWLIRRPLAKLEHFQAYCYNLQYRPSLVKTSGSKTSVVLDSLASTTSLTSSRTRNRVYDDGASNGKRNLEDRDAQRIAGKEVIAEEEEEEEEEENEPIPDPLEGQKHAIGKKVYRNFGFNLGWHYGKIISVDSESREYRVMFTDGGWQYFSLDDDPRIDKIVQLAEDTPPPSGFNLLREIKKRRAGAKPRRPAVYDDDGYDYSDYNYVAPERKRARTNHTPTSSVASTTAPKIQRISVVNSAPLADDQREALRGIKLDVRDFEYYLMNVMGMKQSTIANNVRKANQLHKGLAIRESSWKEGVFFNPPAVVDMSEDFNLIKEQANDMIKKHGGDRSFNFRGPIQKLINYQSYYYYNKFLAPASPRGTKLNEAKDDSMAVTAAGSSSGTTIDQDELGVAV